MQKFTNLTQGVPYLDVAGHVHSTRNERLRTRTVPETIILRNARLDSTGSSNNAVASFFGLVVSWWTFNTCYYFRCYSLSNKQEDG